MSKRIDSIAIKQICDPDADTSYLGEYTDTLEAGIIVRDAGEFYERLPDDLLIANCTWSACRSLTIATIKRAPIGECLPTFTLPTVTPEKCARWFSSAPILASGPSLASVRICPTPDFTAEPLRKSQS